MDITANWTMKKKISEHKDKTMKTTQAEAQVVGGRDWKN